MSRYGERNDIFIYYLIIIVIIQFSSSTMVPFCVEEVDRHAASDTISYVGLGGLIE